MKSTQYFAIPYPEKSDPPTVSTHIENIAKAVDTTLHDYQTTMNGQFAQHKTDEKAARDLWTAQSTALWASWKGPMDAKMDQILSQLSNQGWGTPVTLTGTLFTGATGWTALAGTTAVKVGNVCAFTIAFQKAALPAIVAGATGNLANPGLTIGTLSSAMPTPTAFAPFTTTVDGFNVSGYIHTNKSVILTALAPNVNLANAVPIIVGGMYMFNPLVP